MTIVKFLIGLVLAVAAVGLWSFTQSAPIETILLRMVISAIVLQVGYFVVVLVMIWRSPARPAGNETPPVPANDRSRADNVSSADPSHS